MLGLCERMKTDCSPSTVVDVAIPIPRTFTAESTEVFDALRAVREKCGLLPQSLSDRFFELVRYVDLERPFGNLS